MNSIHRNGVWHFESAHHLCLSMCAMREAQSEDEFCESIRLTLDHGTPNWGREVEVTRQNSIRRRGLLFLRTRGEGGRDRLVLPVMVANDVIRYFYASRTRFGSPIYSTRRALCRMFFMENLFAFIRAFEKDYTLLDFNKWWEC